MTVKGIDVSSYQAATWSTAGLSFVMIKATEGHTLTDTGQAKHAARARAAGLVTGFYHFLWPGSIQAQAEYFVSKCASVDGDILAVDWETTSSGTVASCAEKDAFIAAVKKLRPTHKVVLYCNSSFWTTKDTTSNCGDGLWIAEYGVPAGKPNIQHAWTFHQYTSSPLDTNVGNFASKAALKTWATGSTPPPTPPKPPEPPVSTFTVEEMAANYGTIDSLTEVDAKGKPVPHSGGYYLAHIHYDALTVNTKIDSLTKAVADLTALVKTLTPPKP